MAGVGINATIAPDTGASNISACGLCAMLDMWDVDVAALAASCAGGWLVWEVGLRGRTRADALVLRHCGVGASCCALFSARTDRKARLPKDAR